MRIVHASIVAAAALAIVCAYWPIAALGQAQPAASAAKPIATHPKVKISKETTYITEPLRPDGYPDYIRYLDEKLSRGVTPDNNAVVALLRATGPREIAEKHRDEFFKKLGIEPLAAKGNYFIDWSTYSSRYSAKDWPAVPRGDTRSVKEYFEDLDREAGRRPWTSDDFPQLAEWILANDKKISEFVVASRRSRMYSPLIIGDDAQSLVSVLLPIPQNDRMAARALAARAMFRAGNNDVDGAIEDLIACHRLARLTSHGFSMVEGLVAIAIDHIALDAEAALISAGKLTSNKRAMLRAELEKLPALRRMADNLDQGERLMYADSVCWIAREGASALRQLSSFNGSPGKGEFIVDLLGNLTVDWNIPLKVGNEWYDRYVAIARIPDPKKRLAALEKIERDIKAAAAEVHNASTAISAIISPRETASKTMANVFVALLLPALNAALQAEHRNDAKHDLFKIALSLADYRGEHQRFPDKLDALAPKYVDKIPLDPMWGEPFVYRKTEDGYVLYALGMNGQDDGGNNSEDAGGADDLVITVPGK